MTPGLPLYTDIFSDIFSPQSEIQIRTLIATSSRVAFPSIQVIPIIFLPSFFGFMDGKYDCLRVISSSISINDNVRAIR
jgi:hypothetical protein